MQNKEEVFHFGGEGGGISIFRSKTKSEVKFIYEQSECYLDDNEELQFSSKTEEYTSFEEAFKPINDNYAWYTMVIEVSKEFKSYVLDQIQYNPNMAGKSKAELSATVDRTNEKFEERENLWDLLNEE